MGMPLELNWLIVCKNTETRIGDNKFELVKDGYRLYPLDIPIEIKRDKFGPTCAIGTIESVKWENNKTTIVYAIEKLNTRA